MTTELKDKVAVVTGGTRGIGRSIAQALVSEGTKVFICGRDASNLKTALEQLGRNGGRERVDGIAADVSRYEDCRKVIGSSARRFGSADADAKPSAR